MLFELERMTNKYKTIDTLSIIEEFLGHPKNFYNEVLSENESYIRLIEVKNPHYLVCVIDVPKQVVDGNLVITYYKGYKGFAKDLKAFLNRKGIDTELKPFKKDVKNMIQVYGRKV